MAHITISDETPEVSYNVTTASTGPYTIPFEFFEADGSDLAVYLDGELVDDEDYTVTPTPGYTGGYPGGSLTFDATIENVTLTIVGKILYERLTDFPNSGPLDIPALNSEIDKAVARDKQLANLLENRSLRVEPGQSVQDIDLEALDGKMLIGSGNAIIGQSIADPLETPDQVIDFIHVQDFGAVGDNVTDDTTALNLALSYMRTQTGAQSARKVILTGGAFIYRVNGSLNATGITGSHNWGIQNLRIEAHCTGKTVLDLTNSRFGVFKDIYIWGDGTDQPYNGIQQCRPASGAASGSHHFINVKVLGHYTNAALHNYGSEVCHYDQCKFWNSRDSDVNGEAWAAIFDGTGLKTPLSDFETPVTGVVAFNLTNLTSCEFRKVGSNGSTVFLSRYVGFHARSCYAVCNDTAHISIYSQGPERNFYWDGHFEGTAPTGIVRFVGPAGNNTSSGFTLIDHSPHVFDQIFESDATVTRTTIYDLDVRIANYDVGSLTVGVFDDPTKYSLIGVKIVEPGEMNNLSSFVNFIGEYRSLTDTEIRTWGHVAYSDSAGVAAGPDNILDRNSASPAASDAIGRTVYRGRDSGGNATEYASAEASIVDPTDTSEDGRLVQKVQVAGTLTEITRLDSNGLSMYGGNPVIDANRHHRLRSYTVAGLPSASPAAQLIYVSNESGGAQPAFSDGVNWRRFTDRAVVS